MTAALGQDQRAAMAGIEAQLEAIRSRLRQLLSTHLNQLQPVTRSYAAGEIVIEQGEAAERVFLVSSGVLAVEHVEPGHPARVLALVQEGEILGEMGLFGDNRHSAQVRVEQGPASLLVARSDDLLQALLFDTELVLEMLALSGARCRQANHNLAVLLDAIQALSANDDAALTEICSSLRDNSPSLAKAAEQLLQIQSSNKR